ncbi:MAG TPA: glutamate-1-semialdehyde 2,1-aminomutase [Vampirovibrionales bacterium]
MNSQELFQEAQTLFPGGVNSPVRAFKSVGGSPVFFERAKGAYLYDVEGKEYVDYVGSWGPMVCGHNHPEVISAIHTVMQQGLSFGACHPYEIKLGKLVKEFMPNIELLRFTSSGTEACMSAIRLARAYTKKPKILKFAGCYHGHFDSFLVQAGSGVSTFSLPDSPGVLKEVAENTLVAEFNNLESVKKVFQENKDSIACIIFEPIVGNAGCIPPQEGFLQGLRDICDENKALLVFDEVMTGFRVAKGGAQELYGIKADLVTLGKILGGGLPVGAFGGKKEIMEHIAPSGSVYQAGTLSGGLLGMAAGAATLELLKDGNMYKQLEGYGQKLEKGIKEIAAKKDVKVVVNRVASMISIFFTELNTVNNFENAKTSDLNKFSNFYKSMLNEGIYLPPSQYEAWFFSATHSDVELNKTLAAIEKAI